MPPNKVIIAEDSSYMTAKSRNSDIDQTRLSLDRFWHSLKTESNQSGNVSLFSSLPAESWHSSNWTTIYPLFRPLHNGAKDTQAAKQTGAVIYTPMTMFERVHELTRINSFLLQIIAAHKDKHNAEVAFAEVVMQLHARLEDTVKYLNIGLESGSFNTYSPFHRRPKSGRAGDITVLDHRIAMCGGTTSSYEELPHMLQKYKTRAPISLIEREDELVGTNRFLLEELKYHRGIREVETKFVIQISALRDKLENVQQELLDAWEERSKAKERVVSAWLGYWGTSRVDGDLEDVVF